MVLSGVGVYGYSGLALMEFFYKNQIHPSLIVGCSEGALIAGLWAKGYSPKAARAVIKKAYELSQNTTLDYLTVLSFFKRMSGKHTKESALLKVSKIQALYRELFEEQRVEHLPVQTIFQTTNAVTGETHYIREGKLADAIYASSAILPFYPPIKIGKHWFVDGVFSEFLPLKVVLDEKSDLIIIVEPNISVNIEDKHFMYHYAQFVQKSLKSASAPRTALVYDLHNSEIVAIPIKMKHTIKRTSEETLQSLLDSSRQSVAMKEAIIFHCMQNRELKNE